MSLIDRHIISFVGKSFPYFLGVLLLSWTPCHKGIFLPSADYWILVCVYAIVGSIVFACCKSNPNKIPKKYCVLSLVLSVVFSLFISIGESFFLTQSMYLCLGSLILFIHWLAKTILYAYLTFPIVKYITGKICYYQMAQDDTTLSEKKLWIVNISSRLFFLIVYFPCNFDYDAGFSLNSFLSFDEQLTDHHPFFVQLLQISFYRLGLFLGNPSIGMALLTLVLILFSTSVIVYGAKVLKELGTSSRWIKRVTYIFAFFPLFPIISVSPTKTGFFAYSFLFFFLTLLRIYATKGGCLCNLRFLLLHSLSILLVCLTRHEGVYIVTLEALLMTFAYYKLWRRLVISNVLAICAFMFFQKILLPAWNVEPGGKQEIFGIFFNQTAYCLKQHPDDITLQEVESINRILPVEEIVRDYQPHITDYVKMHYIKDSEHETENLKAYLKTWCSMFLRHPLTHFEAYLNVTYGFFYNKGVAVIGFDWDWMNRTIEPQYVFKQNLMFTLPSNVIAYRAARFPFLSWLASITYYIWAALLLVTMLIAKNKSRILTIVLPIILSLCVLLICPVVDGRYAYPIVFTLPYLLMLALKNHDIC